MSNIYYMLKVYIYFLLHIQGLQDRYFYYHFQNEEQKGIEKISNLVQIKILTGDPSTLNSCSFYYATFFGLIIFNKDHDQILVGPIIRSKLNY